MADEALNNDDTAETPATAETLDTTNAPEVADTAEADADTDDDQTLGDMAVNAETPAETPATIVADSPVVLTGAALIDTLDKDALEVYCRAEFNREIDKRKKIDTLRWEAKQLLDGSTQRAEAAEAKEVAKVEARASQTPIAARHKTLTNPETDEAWEFEWNPLFEGNPDLEPVYAD